jgi:predicted O-methyltransferase YrrM
VRIPAEISKSDRETIIKIKPFTMTTNERIYMLMKSVEYIIKRNIPGDFVECGVWRGGSVMAIAQTLKNLGVTDRKIWLYDTFDGMTEPSDLDFDWTGVFAKDVLVKQVKVDEKLNTHAFASINAVKKNLRTIDYDFNNFIFVVGDVQQTIIKNAPKSISLLRLDTDWYDSTLVELQQLFPLLNRDGILILDDFGQWAGSRKAATEYFDSLDTKYLMNIVDKGARLIIKN